MKVSLFFFCCFYIFTYAVTQTEVDAITALYDATNGDNWSRNWNWFQGNPCTGNWWGIFCNPQGHISQVIMPSNNLVGTIPPELGNLTDLFMLAFFNNHLYGTLPESLSNCKDLGYIQLNFNHVSGTIPESIGNWHNLIELSLIGNEFSGTIPESLGNFQNAKYIMMHSNNLVGSIPASFANFGSATRVKVSQNKLNGTLPWQSNPGYDVFDARDNVFECPLPSWCSYEGDGSCEPCVYT